MESIIFSIMHYMSQFQKRMNFTLCLHDPYACFNELDDASRLYFIVLVNLVFVPLVVFFASSRKAMGTLGLYGGLFYLGYCLGESHKYL